MTTRSLSTAQEAAVESRVGAPRYFVEIRFDEGVTRFWTGIGVKELFGFHWTGVGRLGSIDVIEETVDTVAVGVKLSLTVEPSLEVPDAPDEFLNIALGVEYQGRPVTIYQAMFDPDDEDQIIGDLFVRFKGYMDQMEDFEEPGRATIQVTAENRLIDLERARNRRYTGDDQKSRYSMDTFFDEVARLQQREIVLS